MGAIWGTPYITGEKSLGKEFFRLAKHFHTYPVTVNYNLSLGEMIGAGRYNWVHSDITSKHFPIKGEGMKEVVTELVHFNRYMESVFVLRELGKRSLRPATIEELLAFGAKCPETQRQFPILGLGSLWWHLGVRLVPLLWCRSVGRGLDLDWSELWWRDYYRFLAVRK